MTASLRPFVQADLEAIAALIGETLTEFGFASEIGGLRADLAEAELRYSGPRAGFWVAQDAAELVGCVAIRPKDDDTCELKRLYLRRDARGRGLGQRLYAHAEAFAREAGYHRIWLDSSRRFAAARRLYERNGLVLLRELDNDWEDNVYEKSLLAP